MIRDWQILWTDFFVYILVFSLLGFMYVCYHDRNLKEKWQQVIARPLHVIALVTLLLYGAIGLLDTIHYRDPDKGMIFSLLDDALQQLREQNEKTYSAPYATHQYNHEMQKMPDGRVQWIYPRLLHAGQDLNDPNDSQEHWQDIRERTGVGLLWATVFGTIFLLFTMVFYKFCPNSTLHRQSFILTFLCWIVVASVLWQHSQAYHVMGTDKVGRDVFYIALKSIRTGLVIGTLTTLVMLPFAVLLGTFAGYFRGWVDDVIQYLYTTLSSVPGVLLIAASVLSLQIVIDQNPQWFDTLLHHSDMRLLVLCVILGITSWTSLCRLLRGETLKLREMEYVQAAKVMGIGDIQIIFRHIIPNVMHIILIAVALDFSGLVLAEAVLSYVGVGVDPSTFSWGNMINAARLEMAREPVVWWSLTAAFAMMFILVLSANLFSDALRDAFDPKTQRSHA